MYASLTQNYTFFLNLYTIQTIPILHMTKNVLHLDIIVIFAKQTKKKIFFNTNASNLLQ